MDLFRAPRLNAHDYLVRIFQVASGFSGNAAGSDVSDGNRGGVGRANGPASFERPFFQTTGEALSAEILFLKLHLLETLAAELLPRGETLSHPQIPRTLDRIWLRADHRLSHVPYFWRFSLEWLEPANAPPPNDVPQSGMGYCLNALALIWQSVLEFDENQRRQKRKNSDPHSEAGKSETEDASRKPDADIALAKAPWEMKILEEAIQIGDAMARAARREVPADSADFLEPIRSLKNQLWERMFTSAPPSAQPEAFPPELQAALHRIADRWEESLVEKGPPAEEAGPIEESAPAVDAEDDEFFTETIVIRPGQSAPPPQSPEESAPPSEPEDSLAETLVLKEGRRTGPDSPPPPSETPKPPPNSEPGLAETVVLRGSGKKKNGASDSRPSSVAPPESPREEEDDLAATVVVRPRKTASVPFARPEAEEAETTAPADEPKSPDSLTETVILRPGRSRGKERP